MKMDKAEIGKFDSIISSTKDDFLTLVKISGLDPRNDFKFFRFDGMDFSNCNLDGFDFTGSDFSRADIGGADFSGAITTGAIFPKPGRQVGAIRAKRVQIVRTLSQMYQENLLATGIATFESQDHRVVCTISKKFGRSPPYWFAYHRSWDDYLNSDKHGVFVLGCLDLNQAFSIPRGTIHGLLPRLNMSLTDKKQYWHIHVTQREDNFELIVPKASNLDLAPYRFDLFKKE